MVDIAFSWLQKFEVPFITIMVYLYFLVLFN